MAAFALPGVGPSHRPDTMTEQLRAKAAALSRLWARAGGHLTEDELVALATGETDAPEPLGHAEQCPKCEAALVETTDALDLVRQEAVAGFDDVFTSERLQTQRRRISHRLATLVGAEAPAKVIRFPFSVRPLPQTAVRTGRWVWAATAAGLVIGVGAGQLMHFHDVPLTDQNSASDIAIAQGPQTVAPTYDMTGTVELPPLGNGLRHAADGQASLTLDDFDEIMGNEDFLADDDLELTSFLVSELESIDALTPHVGDLPVDIR